VATVVGLPPPHAHPVAEGGADEAEFLRRPGL
jgi:hypothetical protein